MTGDPRRVLVTGGRGQVATALAALAPRFAGIGLAMTVLGRPDFDFDRPETLDDAIGRHRPDLVVNAAAWTAVDAAEAEPEAARRANAEGPARLAALCAARGATLLHFSTDYVFDGTKAAPYVEADPTNPTGVYGLTKRDGERAVLAACPRTVVLRTAWVYSATGGNFVKTMLAAGRARPELRVVADQVGNPTAAADLALAVLAVATRWREGWRDRWHGTYHAAGSGEASWHGFAGAIFAAAAERGLSPPAVLPIATADWPTPARRPANSRLDCTRLAETFGFRFPAWRESLATTVDALMRPAA